MTATLAPLGALGYAPWTDTPLDHGLAAWNYDPALAQVGASALTSGTIQFVAVYLPQVVPITGIALRVSTIGATLTANQNLLGLYSYQGSTFTLISATADQSAVWTSLGNKFANLSTVATGLNGVAPGIMYVGILAVGTTPPIFQGIVPTALVNVGQLTPRAGAGAAAQTALPATVAQAAVTPGTILPWVGLY